MWAYIIHLLFLLAASLLNVVELMRKNFDVLILLFHWLGVLWVLRQHHEFAVAYLAYFATFDIWLVCLYPRRAKSARWRMFCSSIYREATLLRAVAPRKCISRILRLEFPMLVHAFFTDSLPTELTMLQFSCTGKILFAKIALLWGISYWSHRPLQLEYSICYVKISGLITNFDFVFLLSEVTRQHEIIFIKYLRQNSLRKRHTWRRSLLRSPWKLSLIPNFISMAILCNVISCSRRELPFASIRIGFLILLRVVGRLCIIVQRCFHELFIIFCHTILRVRIRLLLHFIYNPISIL